MKNKTYKLFLLLLGTLMLFSTHVSAEVADRLYEELIAGRCAPSLATLQSQAAAGDADAQFNLAWANGNGFCLPKSDAQWFYWVNKAAVNGHISARLNLAIAYEHGLEVAKDEGRAVFLYRRLADDGSRVGQFNMGRMNENGMGGLQKDDLQAVAWYRKSAEQGLPAGQESLARMYADGRGGLKKDMGEAEMWRKKAAYQRSCKSCNDFCQFSRPGAPMLSALLCLVSPASLDNR